MNEIPLLKTAWLCAGIEIAGLSSGFGFGWFGFSQEHTTPRNSRRGIRLVRILNIIGYQSVMLLNGCFVVTRKCGALFVYLLEALGSPYQINNTPHPYGDTAIAGYTKQGDECMLILDT